MSEKSYRSYEAEYFDLAQRMKSSWLRLVYHNHAHELERFGDQTGLDTLFGAAAGDALQAELDTYWLQFGGANPAAWIRRFKSRVPLVHLKDMAVLQGNPVVAEYGEGKLDWIEFLGSCRNAADMWHDVV